MPQAVSAYLETNNMMEVDKVKRNIIQLYEADFYRIDPSGRLSMLFDAIPAQLNSNASRFQVGGVLGDSVDSEKVQQLLSELSASKTVNIAHKLSRKQNLPGFNSLDITAEKLLDYIILLKFILHQLVNGLMKQVDQVGNHVLPKIQIIIIIV